MKDVLYKLLRIVRELHHFDLLSQGLADLLDVYALLADSQSHVALFDNEHHFVIFCNAVFDNGTRLALKEGDVANLIG